MQDRRLSVPVLRQKNWCACGPVALNMALRYRGLRLTEKDLERNPLVPRKCLQELGFGPGRLGRLALSYGFETTIIDPSPRDVGKRFVREGGRWIRRSPGKQDLLDALQRNIPPVVCIPDKSKAFGPSESNGSHWVIVVGVKGGELRIHDPGPWRKATHCTPGYWDSWRCTAVLVGRRRI